MNAVISLCHFCELHGPSVLFSTQAFHQMDAPCQYNQRDFQKKHFYGNVESLNRKPSSACKETCEACQAFSQQHLGFISNDHKGCISYLSTRHTSSDEIASLVHQACVRSLSCEVSPGKEGPIFFGDETRGHVLSHTFFLKDAQARGFHRWFSITILMKDKFFLLNSWPFLVEKVKEIMEELQLKAAKVYKQEQADCPQRPLRLAAVTCSDHVYKQQNTNKSSRSLIELTNEEFVFPQLHLWFTWLLSAGAHRLLERMTEGFPTSSLAVNLHLHQETEEGFTVVSTTAVSSAVHELEASYLCEADKPSAAVHSVRHLYQILGSHRFIPLAYNLIIGRQIVVRGQPKELVDSVITSLKVLVPRHCFQAVINADRYMDGTECNLLGLEPQVAVPQPNPNILRLDILQSPTESDIDISKYIYKITWAGKLPAKYPSVLMKMVKVIENNRLSEVVMNYQFVALKEEWLNIAKAVRKAHQPNGNLQETANLLHCLGVQEHDRLLLDFWGKNAK